MFAYIWRTLKRIDYLLVLAPLALGFFSILMLGSIRGSYGHRQVITQTAAYALGFALLLILAFLDHGYFRRFERWLYPFAILLQLSVFTPLGLNIMGQRIWLNLGFTTIQPSEFVKIIFVLCFASYLTRNREDLFTFKGFLFAFLYAAPLVGVVAMLDMGSGLVMMFMFIGMIFAAGLRGRLFCQLGGAFVIMLPFVYRILADHQQDRITAFLHPDNAASGATYQVNQSKIAIGSGGIFGKGLGNGTIKASGYLPVQDSDFIYAILCEELGFLGGAAVIVIYALLLCRMWRVIRRSREVYGALVVVGFLSMFGFQMFENLGMVMGIMPVAGLTLPFLSAGGSSVLANMIIIGIVIGIGVSSKVKSYKNIPT